VGAVRQIKLHEFEILGAGELRQPRFLELRIVIRRQIIDADDVAALFHQSPRDVKADKAGSAGDEYGMLSHRCLPAFRIVAYIYYANNTKIVGLPTSG
jgi:hypothetical protein